MNQKFLDHLGRLLNTRVGEGVIGQGLAEGRLKMSKWIRISEIAAVPSCEDSGEWR